MKINAFPNTKIWSRGRHAVGWLLAILGLCSPAFVEAQQPTMFNMQLLACHFSPDRSELTLALMSMSEQTHPTKSFGFRDELEVVLEMGEESRTLVENGDLVVAVIGDLMREIDRQHTLVRFAIVMDESGSIDDASLLVARQVVDRFLNRIPKAYEAQILRFANGVEALTPFTNDPQQLNAALGQPRIEGGTAFYDAVDQAYTELRQAEPEVPLSFVVAFTDGEDTASQRFSDFSAFKSKIENVSHRDQMPLFLAGIGSDLNHQIMGQLAGETGVYVPLGEVGDLDRLFEVVANAIELTYVVRVPVSSKHSGLSQVFVKRRRANGNHDTVQDVPLPAACIPG